MDNVFRSKLKQYKLIFTHLKEIYNKVIDDSIELIHTRGKQKPFLIEIPFACMLSL